MNQSFNSIHPIIFAAFWLSATFLVPTDNALGQKSNFDEPVGIFDSEDQYHQFMGEAKRAAYGPDGTPEMKAMIPLLNDIALNKPIGSTASQYGVEGSTLGLLADPNVRKDLEMVDDQYEQLKELNESIQSKSAQQFRAIDFSSADWMEQLAEIRKQTNSELDSLLLPHQIDRLKQIRLHSELRRRSFVEILTNDPVKSKLEITDQQSQRLRDTEKQIEADLQKEIARLRVEAREKLLAELDSSQRTEVETMFGDVIEFEAPATKKKARKK
jgi:hypothetical protein